MNMNTLSRALVLALALPFFPGCSSDDGVVAPPPVTRTLTVLVTGNGTVTSVPAGINGACASANPCTAQFPDGTDVQLTASPGVGATFDGWAVACSPSNEATCTLLMDRDRQEVAIFGNAVSGGIGDTFALSDTNRLLTFNRATPGTLSSNTAVTGLVAGDSLAGIDFRPSNGLLYGLALTTQSQGRLYVIDKVTAAATEVSVIGSGTITLTGTDVGVDFDAVNDSLVVTDQSKVYVVTPGTGSVISESGITGEMRAFAISNSFKGAVKSTWYAIDSGSTNDRLYTLSSSGTRTAIGANLGITVSGINGFDLEGTTGIARLAYNSGGAKLTTINLTTGVADVPVAIGFAGTIRGLAIPTVGEPEVFAICESSAAEPPAPNANTNFCIQGRTLVKFRPSNPANYSVVGEVALPGGVTALALDVRPSTGALVALASDGSLYTIDATSAVPTLLSSITGAVIDGGQLYGIDFDAATDKLRVLGRDSSGSFNVNLLVNPDTGVATVENPLMRPPFTITGIAYSDDGLGSATLYGLDYLGDRLLSVSGGNGRLADAGSLGVDAAVVNGFDIDGIGTAFAIWNVSGAPKLVTVNLTTGQATVDNTTIAAGGSIASMTKGSASDVFAATAGTSPHLVSFNPTTPATLNRDAAITGLQANESILALDFQPNSNTLYAVGSTGRLYTINTGLALGVATSVGVLAVADVPPTPFPMTATNYDIDFDPASPNDLKMVDDTGRNVTINAATALVSPDTDLIKFPNPVITSAAYTKSFAASTATKLVVFNANGEPGSTAGSPDTLMSVAPPASGNVIDIGVSPYLDVDADTGLPTGLDIAGADDGLPMFTIQVVGDVSADSFTTVYTFDPVAGSMDSSLGIMGIASSPTHPADTRIVVRDIAIRFPPQ